MKGRPTPNPGSKEALEKGCKCPRYDNRKGAGIIIEGEVIHWINDDCEMHGGKVK